MISLLLSLLPPALIVAGVVFYARAKAFDKITTLLILLALGVYYFHFYSTSWVQFAVDAEPHMTYIEFLIEHHRLPTAADNTGAAARHPPAFYLASAALLGSANTLGLAEPVQFTRHIAMLCYVIFIVMSTGMLRLMLKTPSMAYFSALLLLLFWPIGVTMGGRISCDILLFAGQAGALFALMRWQQDKSAERLCAPFIWGGIAVMGKNSGIIMIGFAGIALLKTAYDNRSNLRVFLRKDLAGAIVFASASAAFSLWHGWIMQHLEARGYYWDYLWQMTSSFSAFLFMYDTDLGLSQESFWNMWLHSLLLGDATMRWQYPDLMLASKVLWLALLFYATEGLIAARKALSPSEKGALQLLAVFVILMIVAALYLLLRTANVNYADARYAYPAVIAFALMHGLVMKHHHQAGRYAAYRIGSLLSIAFASVTLLLFGVQYLG
jgi:hypothetical protein